MLHKLRAAIARLYVGSDISEYADPGAPVVKDGKARIHDPEQIPEINCDISSKDEGERYLGLETGIVYIIGRPWERND